MQEATPKILLVDNGNLSRKLTRTTLADEKFQILEASDSKTALELVEREAPSLLLLNSNLENGNLMEFSRKLAGLSEIRNFHIIFLVEKQKQELIEKIKKLGIMDFFYKPFSPIELLKKVHNFYSESYEDFIDINGGSVEEIKNQVGNTEFHTPEEIKNLNADQLLLYALDVSRLHNKEIEKAREMKKAIQKLKDSEKMKDMFIALVSHELRTPLSIIKGYLYLLQEVLDSSSLEQDISSFMNPISKAANKLEGLMSELLDFSRMKSGLMTFEKREINLSNFLALILKEFKPEFEKKNIEYVLNIEEDFRPVKADYERIKEAFSHFIRNSINFTQPGGRVMITGKDEGIWVEISFSDTGKGIAESHLDKIFSPFYQSENFLTREVGGMGLGLAIAKHIIEDHGGSINVSSVVGKGTTFTLRLPRSYQDAREIVAELKQTYPRQVEELSRNLKATQEQLLAYAQELNTVYAKEKQRTKQLEETLNALERTYIQTIAALSRTVDLKDAYTTPHTDRVSYYAMEIAKHINPELISQRTFKYSLLLHDIGKIGVAEDFLSKVEKLTEEEGKILTNHPAKGVEILKDIEFLAPALAAVRSHHERWDGKGYPDGLKGEEIPLEARIIAVADSFDAMTTDRPYRKGMTAEEAKEEIRNQSGHQFDPEVVDSFLEVWPRIVTYSKTLDRKRPVEFP